MSDDFSKEALVQELEAIGERDVWHDLNNERWGSTSDPRYRVVYEWYYAKIGERQDAEREAARRASEASQAEHAATASRAASAAERAAVAAEAQARTADKALTTARIAATLAAIALAMSMITLFLDRAPKPPSGGATPTSQPQRR